MVVKEKPSPRVSHAMEEGISGILIVKGRRGSAADSAKKSIGLAPIDGPETPAETTTSEREDAS